MKHRLIAPMVLFFVSTGLLVSCQPLSSFYVGKHSAPDTTIALALPGPQEGIWENFEMTISYRYQAGEVFSVTGTALLGRHYRDLYQWVQQMDLYLFLLDDRARVLTTERIIQLAGVDTQSPFPFAVEMALPLPAEASQIAFGYDVRVSGSDPDPSGGSAWFYKLPLANQP